MAVPGPINQPTSAGTNKLLQEGAKVVLRAEDVLEELKIGILSAKEKIKINMDKLSNDEKIIVNLIQAEPVHIDKIIQTTKLKPQVVGSVLTNLELQGYIKNSGGQIYIIAT